MEHKEILKLMIELPDGGSESLVVHDTDEPAELAASFCRKFKLDLKDEEKLVELIEKHIDFLIEAENSSGPFKKNLVRQAIILQPRQRSNSPMLITQAKKVHEAFIRSQPKRSTSMKKRSPETDVNKNGLKIPLKTPFHKKHYDKLDRYFSLFELLNPNPEGKVSPKSLKVPALPANMLEIINPLINELKASNKTIGFFDFTQAMDRITANLEEETKALLLEPAHKKEYGNIGNQSARMAIYERQLLIRMKNDAKLKEKRINNEIKEMQQCRVQPALRSGFRK